jgi:hypothetical protein
MFIQIAAAAACLTGVMTEFLMQMTPPSYTELITVKKSDKDMFRTINELLKVGLRA